MSRYDDVDGAGGQSPGRSPRGRFRAHRWRRIVAWLSIGLTFVLVAATLSFYAEYRKVWNSIHRVSVTDLGKRPPKLNSALNILVIGSASRAGLTLHQQYALHVGHDPGTQSDTVMLVHLSPGGRRMTVLNFPRDIQVPTYACAAHGARQPGQQANLAAYERINTPFAYGGPSCLWKTVEQQTGIHLDHFIELTFTGFVKVINDLGGVNVCVPFAVNDPTSGLRLKAGQHHIRGIQALAFWRTREGLGMGSDLQRIQRDQYLMASLLQGIEHSGVLTSPTKMLSVVGDVAGAMTTDAGLSQSDLLTIGESLHGLAGKGVQFITVPNVPDPGDPNLVDFEQPQASELFKAIARDKKLPKPSRKKTATTRPKTVPVLDANPSQVNVKVLNGSGVNGIAGTTEASLASRGFNVVGTGDAANFGYTNSVIEYASAADKPAVKTLRHQLSNITVQQDSSLTPGTLVLIIGSSYQGLRTPSSPSASPKPSKTAVGNLARSFNGITGNASCRSDSAAFAGPNSPPVP
jgi:LCP family protein required for cell wall assembly